MLSNPPPTSNLHSRQRQHRRQNSTPTAFEAVNIAPLPNYHRQQQQQQQQQQQHLQQQQQQRSHVSHRRGMSLDTRRLHLQQLQQQPTSTPASTRQDFGTVSTTTTNTPGLSTTPQHVLRETQQQRTARPGPSQLSNISNISNVSDMNSNTVGSNNHNMPVRTPSHSRHNSISSVSSSSSVHTRGHSRSNSINHFGMDENSFLVSPHGTPQSQRFANSMSSQGQLDDMAGGLSFDPYMSAMNIMMRKSQESYDAAPTHSFDLYAPDSTLPTPTFLTFGEASPASHQGWISEDETTGGHSRPNSRRISNGILDRVSRFETIAQSLDVTPGSSRPGTPPGQNDNRYYPPTALDASHDQMMKQPRQQARLSRFAEDYDESMEETLKPTRGNRSGNTNSASTIFQEMRQQAEAMAQSQSSQGQTQMPMPYTDAPLPTSDFLTLTSMETAGFIKIEDDFENLPSGRLDLSPDHSQGSSPMPMHPNMARFTMMNPFDSKPDLQPPHDFDSQESFGGHHSRTTSAASSRLGSPHRRAESFASAVSAASIAEINIEETKTDTGVTMEEISLFIEGPDPANGKWTCTFEGCGKKFGRKENIKSHVQTHLNDRQYQCPTCRKCFVRQHDLKRHAKIHTGIKPYPCECGNSFARHDALTRHRQRGMCIGAFDGIVRKVVKRGRPRKNRPEMDERVDKSDRTRRKVKSSQSQSGRDDTMTPSSASSQSGYSDSSAANSPAYGGDFDGVLDEEPFPDIDMMDVVAGGSSSSASARLGLDLPNLRPASSLSPAGIHGISTATMPSSSPFDSRASSCALASVSPEHMAAGSPSTMSPYSYHALPTLNPTTATTTPETVNHHPASPTKSTTSNYTHHPGTPPELLASSSSSPPAAVEPQSRSQPQSQSQAQSQHQSQPHPQQPTEPTTDSRYFDDGFDPDSTALSDHSIGLGTTAAAHALALADVDDENAVWGINEDGMVQMMGSGNGIGTGSGVGVGVGVGMGVGMGSGTKYYEEEDAVALFTNGDDVFFGSS